MSEGSVVVYYNPYITVEEVRIGGDVYPTASTARAAAVLLYAVIDKKVYVILLNQERPEVKDDWVLKTVGGYCHPDENQIDCVRRNALIKLGITLDFCEEANDMLGYSTIRIPITTLFCKSWRKTSKPAYGCVPTEMSLQRATELALQNKVFDDCTKQAILYLATCMTLSGHHWVTDPIEDIWDPLT